MTTINVHPIFVHFPIALLTVYALMEIIRLPILTRQQWYFPTKAVFLFIGILGSFAALQTGELAEDIYRGTNTMSLIRLHADFAWYTVYVYGVLAALYLIESFRRIHSVSRLPQALRRAWHALLRIEAALFKAPLLSLAALAGFVLLTITGGLGGAIVYGPEVDPVVSIIYHLFFPA